MADPRSRRACAALALCAAVAVAAAPAQARRHRRAALAAHQDTQLAQKRVGPGETWRIAQSLHVQKLQLAEGGRIEAAPGRQLVMSVDGVGTAVVPGSYAGDIAFNVPLEVRPRAPGLAPGPLRAALYVGMGLYLPEKSASGLLRGGRVANGLASGVSIASTEPGFDGIVAEGEGRYALQGVRLSVAGDALVLAGPAQLGLDAATTVAAGASIVRFAGRGARLLVEGATLQPGTGLLAEALPGAQAQLALRATQASGDVAYAREGGGLLRLVLERAQYEGALEPRGAPGEAAPSVELDGQSRWVVTRSSRLSSLVLAPGAALEARRGASLALFVEGNAVAIAAGRYAGRIDLQVSASAQP